MITSHNLHIESMFWSLFQSASRFMSSSGTPSCGMNNQQLLKQLYIVITDTFFQALSIILIEYTHRWNSLLFHCSLDFVLDSNNSTFTIFNGGINCMLYRSLKTNIFSSVIFLSTLMSHPLNIFAVNQAFLLDS